MDIKGRKRPLLAVVMFFIALTLLPLPPAAAIPLENEPRHDGALKLLKKSEFDKVISLEKEVLSENPGDLTAYFLLAIAYLGKDDERMALKQAEDVKEIDTEFAGEIYGAMGRFYITRRRYHKSLVYLRESLKIKEDPNTIRHIASIYLGQGNLKSAKEYYRKLLRGAPDYLNLSRIYLAEKDYENAVIYSEKAIKDDPRSSGARLVAGTAYLLTGKTGPARENFTSIMELNPEFFPSAYFLGLIELIEGNHDEAIELFTDFTARSPGAGGPYLDMAALLHLKGELTGAKAAALTAVNLDPLDPVAHLIFGNIYLTEKEYKKADREYSMAAELFPDFYMPGYSTVKHFSGSGPALHTAITLCALYTRAGLYANAVEAAETAAAGGGGANPILAVCRARAEAAQGNMNTARTILASVAGRYPAMATPQSELGGLHEQEGDIKKAIASYAKAVKAAPAVTKLTLKLGDLYRKDNDYGKAEAEYREAIAASPETVAGYDRLASSLAERGELREALKVAEKGVSVNPEDASMKDTIGWIYFRLGSYGEALKAYSDVVSNGTKDPVVYYRLGMVYKELDKNEDAIEAFEKALDINDEFTNAPEAKEMLNKLSGLG
ncbi:MAG: tetratricopeptide repeat protein [Deltaproteobacteria bacterium]|nr:tetratricopeptide repeat protein [Deltaproteobacteria bacterium]